MEGVCPVKMQTGFLLKLLPDVADSSRSEICQTSMGKSKNRETYFFEEKEGHKQRYSR